MAGVGHAEHREGQGADGEDRRQQQRPAASAPGRSTAITTRKTTPVEHRPGRRPEVLAHDHVGQRQRRGDHGLDHPAHVDAHERVVGRLDDRPEHHRRGRHARGDEVDVVDPVDRREVGAEAEAHDRQVGDRLEEARRQRGEDRLAARPSRCAATSAPRRAGENAYGAAHAPPSLTARSRAASKSAAMPGVAVLEALVDARQVGVGGLVHPAERGQRLGQAPPGVALVLGQVEVGAQLRRRRPPSAPRAAARWRRRSARGRPWGPPRRAARSSRGGRSRARTRTRPGSRGAPSGAPIVTLMRPAYGRLLACSVEGCPPPCQRPRPRGPCSSPTTCRS